MAVGSGWQASVAYINLGCYYIVGLPLGFIIGWVLKLGVGVSIYIRVYIRIWLQHYCCSFSHIYYVVIVVFGSDGANGTLVTTLQGIWGGMIFGGTGIQTLVLIYITARCDWDKQVYVRA